MSVASPSIEKELNRKGQDMSRLNHAERAGVFPPALFYALTISCSRMPINIVRWEVDTIQP